MRTALSLVAVVIIALVGSVVCYGDMPVAADRAELSVRTTADEVVIEAYEWEARHDTDAGGCLSSVRLTRVDRELLSGPASARVGRWREAEEQNPHIAVDRPDERSVVLTVTGRLCDLGGEPSAIEYEHEYRYRREYLRHRLTLTPTEAVEGLNEIALIQIPGVGYTNFSCLDAFGHGNAYHKYAGVAARGSIPETEGVAWEDRLPARAMCMFTGTYGGIDWFPANLIAPFRWDGKNPVGSWRIERVGEKARMSVEVYRDSEPVTLDDEHTWNFYTSWPCTTKKFQAPDAHAGFTPGAYQPTVEDIERIHEMGFESFGFAAFYETKRWKRDGKDYKFAEHEPSPPVGDLIRRGHELGMKVVPYIDLPFGCVSRETYEKIGKKLKRTWSDTPDRQRWWYFANPKKGPAVPGYVQGHGCYSSPQFRELTKEFLRTVWAQQDFDGIYYDHAALNHCTNPAHGGEHMTVEGLFEMLDFTRQMMGPGKLLSLHTATELAPCYALQNYADSVICYENYAWALWPRLGGDGIHGPQNVYDDLTLANNTAMNFSTALSHYHEVPIRRMLTKMALWGRKYTGFVRPVYNELYHKVPIESDKPFVKKQMMQMWEIAERNRRRFAPYDLGEFEFIPLLDRPAVVTHDGWASAWKRDGEVLLLVANLRDTDEVVRVIPQANITDAIDDGPLEITVDGNTVWRVQQGDWMRALREVTIPAHDFRLIHLREVSD